MAREGCDKTRLFVLHPRNNGKVFSRATQSRRHVTELTSRRHVALHNSGSLRNCSQKDIA
jgi:hypothetical protein